MSRNMQSILGKAGLVVLVAAIIGVGAYFSKKNEPQKGNNSPTEAASLQQDSGTSGVTQNASLDGDDTNSAAKESKRPARTSGG